MTTGMRTWSRFVLNHLYNPDRGWIFYPDRDIEAVRFNGVIYVRSRTRSGVCHVVRDGGCSCEAVDFDLECWHREAAEYAVLAREEPVWAPIPEDPFWAEQLASFKLH